MTRRDRPSPALPGAARAVVGGATAAGFGALSGALQALSVPQASLGLLAWACLLPLLLPILRHGRSTWTAQRAAQAGLLAGAIAGIARVYWIAETLGRYGGLGPVEAMTTTGLLALYLAFYPAIFLALCARWRDAGVAFPWLAAALWTLLDWVQTWMFSGFPWMTLGVTQAGPGAIAQLAALLGVHGLTFVIVLANASLAQAGARRRGRGLVLALAATVLGASLLYGHLRLGRLHGEPDAGNPLRVGLVQGNVSQDVKWEPGWKDKATGNYVKLTRQLATTGGHDLIVWPETALPFRLDGPAQATHRRDVSALARQLHTPLLVGSLGSRSASGAPGLYNRSFLVDADGELVGAADKAHLVPFGEYLPFPGLFGYLRGLTAQSGAFDAGEGHAALHLPGGPPGSAFGVFICYESIFPSIPRRLVLDGAGFLINTTNDAWFGTTAAPYQHFAMVTLRAIETGRTVVRAANTGISGAVDPDGSTRKLTPLFATRTLTLEVRPRTELTPYVRWGDAIVVLSALLLAVGAAVAIARRRRRVLAQMAAARVELDELATHPVPLQRPLVLLPGYGSSPEVLAPLHGHLLRCFENARDRVHLVDLRRDLSLDELVAEVTATLPPGPVDWVGHSLGGLVAAGAALASGHPGGCRVYALASPFAGTRLATAAGWLRFPLATPLQDLRPGSAALARLRRRLHDLPHLHILRLHGDPVGTGLAPDDGPAITVYDVPCLLDPLRRHRAVHADPRVVRDLILSLRTPAPATPAG